MKKHKSTAAISVLLMTLLLISWADNWTSLKKTSGNINSITSDFIQKKYMKILNKPLISTGKFFFQRPGSLRWEYNTPVRSILLLDNSVIKRYVQRGKDLIQDTSVNMQAMQIVIQEITFWLKGDFDKNPSFKAELKPGSPRKIIMTAREPSLAKIIQKIELVLSNTPGIINKVMIYESGDCYTELEFTKPLVNKLINQSMFREI